MPTAGNGPDGQHADDAGGPLITDPPGKGSPRVRILTGGWAAIFLALGVGLCNQAGTPAVSPVRRVRFDNRNGPVRAIAFPSDGGLVVATRGNVWRIQGDRFNDDGPELRGSCVSFSPDGSMLALGEESRVTIRDVGSSVTRVEIPSRTGATLALAFSLDSGSLAVAGDRGVSVWDVRSGREGTGPPSGPVGVTSLAFTPDGRALAMGDRQGYVQVWDLHGRRSRGGFRAHAFAVTSMEFSRDGRTLVSTSFMDTAARLWDTATLRPVVCLQDHLAPVQAATFAPSGRMLATADREGVARLWDAATGRVLAVLSGNDKGVCAVAFSKDGRTLVTGGVGASLWLWDVAGAASSHVTRSPDS
jgi:WD40 repeat protein